jgi:hypothetical protein
MSFADNLDQYQGRRRSGVGCVSLLIGPYCATWTALKKWADNRGLSTAIVRTSGLDNALAAYTDALLEVHNLQAAVLAAVSPRTADQPALDQQTWRSLTSAERSGFLERWPADQATKRIVCRLLGIREGSATHPFLKTLDDLRSVARILGAHVNLPVLVVAHAATGAIQSLAYLLEIADQVPTVPIVLLADGPTFNVIQDEAKHGDRTATFIRDGAVVMNDFRGHRGTMAPRLTSLPTPVVGQLLNLEAEGVEESVLDAFISASTIDRKAEPKAFDSRAEGFLSMLLEGDPRTAGLFTSQGQPGFFMKNNQPAAIDFLCPSLKIAIEVDGPHHLQTEQFRRDRRKDRELQKAGYLILRFLAEDVTMCFEEVREQILAAIAWRTDSRTQS